MNVINFGGIFHSEASSFRSFRNSLSDLRSTCGQKYTSRSWKSSPFSWPIRDREGFRIEYFYLYYLASLKLSIPVFLKPLLHILDLLILSNEINLIHFLCHSVKFLFALCIFYNIFRELLVHSL